LAHDRSHNIDLLISRLNTPTDLSHPLLALQGCDVIMLLLLLINAYRQYVIITLHLYNEQS